MKKFKFALEGYLKVKKAREQQKLGDLARVMRRVNEFREQQEAFDEKYNGLLRAQRETFKERETSIADLKSMYDYLGALRQRKATATKHIAELQGEVDEKRDLYNAARKERRVVEILREKKWLEYRSEIESEDIKALDEQNQQRQRSA